VIYNTLDKYWFAQRAGDAPAFDDLFDEEGELYIWDGFGDMDHPGAEDLLFLPFVLETMPSHNIKMGLWCFYDTFYWVLNDFLIDFYDFSPEMDK